MRRHAPLEARRLLGFVDAFAGRRVVVLGDFVADEFLYGEIVRISREAPVLVLEEERTVPVPGAGGNAVANLRALDAVPVPVGRVGDDDSGRRLVDEFRTTGVSVSGIVKTPGWATPTKSRVLAGGLHTRRQQIVRIDRGSRRGDLDPGTSGAVDRRLARALERAECLLVADYGYGVATPRRVARTSGKGRRRIPVMVDSRARVHEFHRAAACTPNQEEVELALGSAPLRTDEEVVRGARLLLRRTGNGAVLITRGARGVTLVEPGLPAAHLPAFGDGEVADVTGAGDTVIAVYALASVSGARPIEAAALANCAAGLVVQKQGTATMTRDELRAAVAEAVR